MKELFDENHESGLLETQIRSRFLEVQKRRLRLALSVNHIIQNCLKRITEGLDWLH